MTNTTQSELACNKLIDLINSATEETLPTTLKSKKFKDLLGKIKDPDHAHWVCTLALGMATKNTLTEILEALKEPLSIIKLTKVLEALQKHIDDITDPDYALKVCYLVLGMATKKTLPEVLKALKVPLSIIKLTKVLEALQKHIDNITDPDYAYMVCYLVLGMATKDTLLEVLEALKVPLGRITDPDYAYTVCYLALGKATQDTLLKALEALKVPLGKITHPDYALKVCYLALGKATQDTLLKVLEALKVPLGKITHPKNAFWVCELALGKADPKDLPEVLKALNEPLGKITHPKRAFWVCKLALGKATEETLPEVLKALNEQLGKIMPSYSNTKTLQDIIKNKLEGKELNYQNQYLGIFNSNIGKHADKGLHLEDDIICTMAVLVMLGCQHLMVTNPLCYAGIMGANFLGHVISASISNDYKHANIAAFQGCTSTLLMVGLLYYEVSLTSMGVVLAGYIKVFNQTDPNDFNRASWLSDRAKRLSDRIANTLKLNNHMQDALSYVGKYLEACQKQIDKMASEGIQALLDIIKMTLKYAQALLDTINNKLEGQELSYIVEQILQQEDALIRVVAGLGVLGCQYFMVTNPLCYAGIIGANFLGHVISASISNDYEHANRTAFRGCTSTLLMIGLLYGGVSLAPMAGVLAVYEIVFNQIGLSDGIADTLRINDHMQDIRALVWVTTLKVETQKQSNTIVELYAPLKF